MSLQTQTINDVEQSPSTTLPSNRLKCTLLKKYRTESFGFQVNGRNAVKGNHAVSSVSKNSIADLAGLKLNLVFVDFCFRFLKA